MRAYRERFRPGAARAPARDPRAVGLLRRHRRGRDADGVVDAGLDLAAPHRPPARLPSPDEAAAHVFTPAEQATVAFFRRLQIVGTPDKVRERIELAAKTTAADEVMVATHAYEADARLRSYELVAKAFT